MSSFNARLRLPGQSKLPLAVEVDITNERMTLSSGEREIANWPMNRLDVHSESDGFHILVDGEEVILSVSDSARFATALGVSKAKPKFPARHSQLDPEAVFAPNPSPTAKLNGHVTPPGPTPRAKPTEDTYDQMVGRISEVSAALTSETLSPADAFGVWLRLLKELNRRHGQGSMSADQFYRLNTRLLDLIPEPAPIPPTPGG